MRVEKESAQITSSSSAPSITPINSTVFYVPKQLQLMGETGKEFPNASSGKNDQEVTIASIEERLNVRKNKCDETNTQKQPVLKKEKKMNNHQHPSALNADDLTAIKTVQYACFWYLILTVSAVFLHLTAQNLGGETTFELARNKILGQIAKILAVSNNSFNFCFYMRAKSFRLTFKDRWF